MSTGTTPKGYPFPNGDDPVVNGDNMIQALARAIDTHLGRQASGSVPVVTTDTTTVFTAAVTFPAGRFTATPFVTLSNIASDPGQRQVSYSNVNASGCTVYARRLSGGTGFNVAWQAVQAP